MSELLYKNVERIVGSRPICNLYSQNLDFSSFPLLCDIVYGQLRCKQPQVMRQLPFCAFMHAMTTCLNAWLFKTVTDINGENRYRQEEDATSLIPSTMIIPQPIAEYFAMINTVVTPSGDTVCVNVPDSCLPQMSVLSYTQYEEVLEILPGSFGSATSASHNAYECYVAPYITRRLLEATRESIVYMPLPKKHFPIDTLPNQNLLGYFAPEQLTQEGINLLKKYKFPNTDNMAGRLQCVPDLMLDVSRTLDLCCFNCHFNMVNFHEIQRYFDQVSLVYAQVDKVSIGQHNKGYIASMSHSLYSPYAFGTTTAAQATLFALRRKRTELARGLCYTTSSGDAPNGWADTINYNFEMIGQFGPKIALSHPYLTHPLHVVEASDGDRRYAINKWVKIWNKS